MYIYIYIYIYDPTPPPPIYIYNPPVGSCVARGAIQRTLSAVFLLPTALGVTSAAMPRQSGKDWRRNVSEMALEELGPAWAQWEATRQPLATPLWNGMDGDNWRDGSFTEGPNKGKPRFVNAPHGVAYIDGGHEWSQANIKLPRAAVGAPDHEGHVTIQRIETMLLSHPFVCLGSIEDEAGKLKGPGKYADHLSAKNLKFRTQRNFSVEVGLTKYGEVLDTDCHAWIKFCKNTHGQREKKKAAIDLLLNLVGYRSMFKEFLPSVPEPVWNPCKKGYVNPAAVGALNAAVMRHTQPLALPPLEGVATHSTARGSSEHRSVGTQLGAAIKEDRASSHRAAATPRKISQLPQLPQGTTAAGLCDQLFENAADRHEAERPDRDYGQAEWPDSGMPGSSTAAIGASNVATPPPPPPLDLLPPAPPPPPRLTEPAEPAAAANVPAATQELMPCICIYIGGGGVELYM